MSLFTWFLIIIGVVAVLSFVIGVSQANAAAAKLKAIKDEHPDAQVHVHTDGTTVAIDNTQQVVLLGNELPLTKVSFSQLASVELAVDGNTLSKTNRGSQAVGAAVGAVALGGVGLLLGGLTGSSTTSQTVRRISLKVIVDDPVRPFHDITFHTAIDAKKGDKVTASYVKLAHQQAEQFHALMVNALRQGEQSRSASMKAPKQVAPVSLSAQIKELWDLKEMGAITAEEFEAQKRALMPGAA